MAKRLVSGMRPTGVLHLGHLVGALENWVKLQDEYDCFYMVADWHAFMSEYENPEELERYSVEMVADWISCGIDPERSAIFIQSHIKEHMELYMIFSCITPFSWLERNPTYKEQLKELKGRDLATHGFLGYPVLQAADVLIYRGEVVPVGVDQQAHLELAREIVRRFNRFYGTILPEPKTLLTSTPKLLGIDNRKMSKSFNNYIALSDKPEVIKKKIMKMITDPKKIYMGDKGHPDRCNVCSYYEAFAPEKVSAVKELCSLGKRACKECKNELSRILIDKLSPIQKKRDELLKNRDFLTSIIEKGNEYAQECAADTMMEIKRKIGMFYGV